VGIEQRPKKRAEREKGHKALDAARKRERDKGALWVTGKKKEKRKYFELENKRKTKRVSF
jgi:hypothetical protein